MPSPELGEPRAPPMTRVGLAASPEQRPSGAVGTGTGAESGHPPSVRLGGRSSSIGCRRPARQGQIAQHSAASWAWAARTLSSSTVTSRRQPVVVGRAVRAGRWWPLLPCRGEAAAVRSRRDSSSPATSRRPDEKPLLRTAGGIDTWPSATPAVERCPFTVAQITTFRTSATGSPASSSQSGATRDVTQRGIRPASTSSSRPRKRESRHSRGHRRWQRTVLPVTRRSPARRGRVETRDIRCPPDHRQFPDAHRRTAGAHALPARCWPRQPRPTIKMPNISASIPNSRGLGAAGDGHASRTRRTRGTRERAARSGIRRGEGREVNQCARGQLDRRARAVRTRPSTRTRWAPGPRSASHVATVDDGDFRHSRPRDGGRSGRAADRARHGTVPSRSEASIPGAGR